MNPWMLRDKELHRRVWVWFTCISLRVQVPNNHILTQNMYHNYYYTKPKYPIIRYLDPLGMLFTVVTEGRIPIIVSQSSYELYGLGFK